MRVSYHVVSINLCKSVVLSLPINENTELTIVRNPVTTMVVQTRAQKALIEKCYTLCAEHKSVAEGTSHKFSTELCPCELHLLLRQFMSSWRALRCKQPLQTINFEIEYIPVQCLDLYIEKNVGPFTSIGDKELIEPVTRLLWLCGFYAARNQTAETPSVKAATLCNQIFGGQQMTDANLSWYVGWQEAQKTQPSRN